MKKISAVALNTKCLLPPVPLRQKLVSIFFCVGLSVMLLSLLSFLKEKPKESASHVAVVYRTTKERFVKCLDMMHQEKHADIWNHHQNREVIMTMRNQKRKNINSTIPTDSLYFVFIGDSRIRQIFLLFLEQISQFDFISEPSYGKTFRRIVVHEDVFVFSELLHLAATYHWSGEDNIGHNLEGLIAHLLNTTSYPEDYYTPINRTALNLRPDFVIIGVSTHFMLPTYKDHEKDYSKRLNALKPLLSKLSEQVNVVWLGQFPVSEYNAKNDALNAYVHSGKIWNYNKIAQRILRGIEIWNQGIPLVAEYIRSCSTSQRTDYWPNGHFICGDFVHPGTSALTEVTQLYINKICKPLGIKINL